MLAARCARACEDQYGKTRCPLSVFGAGLPRSSRRYQTCRLRATSRKNAAARVRRAAPATPPGVPALARARPRPTDGGRVWGLRRLALVWAGWWSGVGLRGGRWAVWGMCCLGSGMWWAWWLVYLCRYGIG